MAAQENAQKWQRNTIQAVGRWKAGVSQASAETFCAGLAREIGIQPSECIASGRGAAWQRGVQQTSETEFRSSIEGKADRWLQGMRRAFSTPAS